MFSGVCMCMCVHAHVHDYSGKHKRGAGLEDEPREANGIDLSWVHTSALRPPGAQPAIWKAVGVSPCPPLPRSKKAGGLGVLPQLQRQRWLGTWQL